MPPSHPRTLSSPEVAPAPTIVEVGGAGFYTARPIDPLPDQRHRTSTTARAARDDLVDRFRAELGRNGAIPLEWERLLRRLADAYREADASRDRFEKALEQLRGQNSGPSANGSPTAADHYFRSLIEHTTDMVAVVDRQATVRYISPAVRAVLGFDPSEVVGRGANMLIHPEDLERTRTVFTRAVRAPTETHAVEFRARHGDGTWRTVEAHGRNLLAEAPVGGLVLTVRDVTARQVQEAALRASEERFRLIVEGSEQIFFYTHDRRGMFEYISPSVTEVLGYRPEELRGRSYRTLQTGHDTDGQVDETTEEILRGAQPVRSYTAFTRHQDGTARVMELVESPMERDGEIIGVHGLARDVTARKKAEEALRESEERYRTLFEESRDAIFMTDLCGSFQDVNQAAIDLLGYSPDEIRALTTHDIYRRPEDRDRLRAIVEEQGYVRDAEVTLVDRDGAPVHCLIAASPRRGPDQAVIGYHCIVHDITDRKRAEEQLAFGALHDALTGLPNRTLFIDRLEQAVNQARRGEERTCAVLFLDLDRFKVVNDTMGHAVGDELLVQIGDRIARSVRPGDTIARFGGDEFTVLLENVARLADVTAVCDRILSELAAPFDLERRQVYTSASIGISLWHEALAEPDEMLQNADAALGRAKSRGKSRYELFDRSMYAEAVDRLEMEMDLRHAIEKDQLRVVYQPIVRLDTGELTGFEALARWAHPERGLISPRDFIPIAEDTRIIDAIGEWILRAGCEQLKRWNDQQPPELAVTLSVNLSPCQFSGKQLYRSIATVLEETGVDPRAVNLEITENVIVEHTDAAVELLARIRALGLRLHLDDFGTGYSSLSYLHRLPFDAIKIDQSFVSRMDHDPRSRRLVNAIITLARGLGVDVMAEGVERKSQVNRLRASACQFAQGYYFSEPLDATAATRMLSEWPRW